MSERVPVSALSGPFKDSSNVRRGPFAPMPLVFVSLFVSNFCRFSLSGWKNKNSSKVDEKKPLVCSKKRKKKKERSPRRARKRLFFDPPPPPPNTLVLRQERATNSDLKERVKKPTMHRGCLLPLCFPHLSLHVQTGNTPSQLDSKWLNHLQI